MKRFIKYPLIFLLAITLLGFGFSVPMGPDGLISVAEAMHKPGHTGGPPPGGGPPTVSELPIQYMVFGGLVLIVLAGGIFYLIRKKNKSHSQQT